AVPPPGSGLRRPAARRPRRDDRRHQDQPVMTGHRTDDGPKGLPGAAPEAAEVPGDRESEALAQRLVSCLPAASFELETLCRLAGISASREVETAAVTCEN